MERLAGADGRGTEIMQSRLSWPTLAIVLTTVAIVAAPVFIPREISRWYLAAAANAFRLEDQTLAEHYLARAVAWDAGVVEDGDFWVAQLSNSQWENIDERLDLLEKVVRANPRWAGQAIEMAVVSAEELDFRRAVRALKIAFPDGQPRRWEHLNLLAYFRSLAGIELEEALKDIEQAIELQGGAAELLDTKAWVLHGLGRDLEALPIINEAITSMEKDIGETEPSEPADSLDADEQQDQLIEATSMWPDLVDVRKRIEAAKKKLGPKMWSLAVLHYHRLRIYEAVGGAAEARQDRQWLRERGVPIVDELF